MLDLFAVDSMPPFSSIMLQNVKVLPVIIIIIIRITIDSLVYVCLLKPLNAISKQLNSSLR